MVEVDGSGRGKPKYKKTELMEYMRSYKKKHCRAISKMNKAELQELALASGFLQARHGVKNAKVSRQQATTETKAKTKKEPTPEELKEERKKIMAEISKNSAGADMSDREASAMLAKRKKLFTRLSEIKKLLTKK